MARAPKTTASRMAAMLASGLFFTTSGCATTSSPPLPPNAGTTTAAPAGGTAPTTGSPNAKLTARIVGLGDSLMAGTQSGALLGSAITPNPIAGSPFPDIPATQGNGIYARVWAQANPGMDPLALATSPLPLMAPPGLGALGSILAPTSTGAFTPLAQPCQGNSVMAYSFASALGVRLNPSTKPLDVAIPGQTLHQALTQVQPTRSTCTANPTPGADSDLAFYPILANFGQNITQVQAAASLQPTLALVWLGINDLLNYSGGNGATQPTSLAAFQNDITQVITTLQNSGAKVVVANLVNPLFSAYYTPVSNLAQVLAYNDVPTPLQVPIAGAIDSFLQSIGAQSGSYLTLPGLMIITSVVTATLPTILSGASPATVLANAFAQLQASSTPFGAGDFISASTAGTTASLAAAYNQIIATAAQQHGAALADVNAIFTQAEQAPNEYVQMSGKCCSLVSRGGFFSLDGIHPSNTAYAVFSNIFIAAADTAYSAGIPQISASQLATINAADLYSPH